MTFTEIEATGLLLHLLGESRGDYVVHHDGKRYGGFRSEVHALAIVKAMGWKNSVVEKEAPCATS